MTRPPLLSYIVLSYNYERYIGKTLQSILAQTIQDFEIVVVDDCSSDNSVNVISEIKDPRIRLLINETNRGGAASYNRAVEASHGEWLVNLDADDWIDPRKAETQLAFASANADADIVGTYVSIHDEHDAPHPSASSLEEIFNQPHDLNLVDSWIGANHLCRSSTMVRASAHRRIGLDDPAMVRAPDYELWTRALNQGCQICVIPEKLTFMRLHSRGVTHMDPTGTLLEISYAMLRNLIPLAESRAQYPFITRILAWVGRHPALSGLPPTQGHRLLGMLMQSCPVDNFSQFRATLEDPTGHQALAETGQRVLALVSPDPDPYKEISKLHNDIDAYIEAREFWRSQSEAWEHKYRALAEQIESHTPQVSGPSL